MVDVIDPRITAGIGGSGAQINPLALIHNYAVTQNALLQGQLFKAKQATGQLYTQSLGPDGQPDLGKFGALMASHPETSMYAAEAMNEAVRTRALNADLVNTQLRNKQIQMDGLAGIYAAASTDPSVNSVGDFVKQGYASQMAELGIPKDELIAHLSNPSPGSPASMQGDQLRSWYKVHSLALQHGSNATNTLVENYDPKMAWDPNTGTWQGGWHSPYGRISTVGGQTAQPGGMGAALSAGPTQGAAALNGATSNAPAAPAQFGEPGPVVSGQQKYIGETYYPELTQAAESSQALMNVIGEGRQLLKRATTGRAAPTRLEVGRWLKAAGVSDDVASEVAGGDLTNSQALQKLILYVGTQGMRTANQGNAAVRSVQEWQKFMDANPNLSNDKQAILKMWDFMHYQASLVRQEQNEFNNWQSMGKPVTQFPAKWNNFVNEQTQQYFKSRSKWYGNE